MLVEDGTYPDAFSITKDGLVFESVHENVIITSSIVVEGNDITFDGFLFEGAAHISSLEDTTGFIFINNVVNLDQVTTDGTFINLVTTSDVLIENNEIDSFDNAAVVLVDFRHSPIVIKNNVINSNATGIVLINSIGYNSTTKIEVMFNEIYADIGLHIVIDENTEEVFRAARFNKIYGTTYGAMVNEGSTFDLTLNHWTTDNELDYNKFPNVDPYYLQGYYVDSADMKTEVDYNPTLPVVITITNPIEEIMIGETHQFEYMILPLELNDAPIRFITGNPNLVIINQEGYITPLTSGDVYIQIRSAIVSSIRTQTEFRIITTPGIELIPDQYMTHISVGDTFQLDYLLFPYTIENETATITSSDPLIASIDQNGLVTTHSAGTVTFTGVLDSNNSISVGYTIQVFDALDTTNLLDFLTTKQVNYSQVHEWIAYGFQYNYNDKRAESVSRYYFDDVVINDTKLVPVSYGIRPGEPMDPLPDGYTNYNEHSIYWVVVHDTASAATESNALAHANYLYNNAVAGTALWVSWHYTIDDTYIYQHLPENERGYHAGDGSTNPGEGSYLGGGNRNGIGIEMAINDDGDMMRTWQRTAKLVVDILTRNNLPRDNMRYHNDFSGKDCPNTLRNAGLIPLFEEFVDNEYHIKTMYPDAIIEFTSHNPELLDNHGRILTIPERATTVSYTITITENGVAQSRTFYTYVPGSVR